MAASPVDARTHSYATRKSQNVPMRPSIRLRHTHNDPSSSKQHPATDPLYPQFPPPHVVLHPDDANSKVLLAIGRAFLSVDNRAMTIKDLSEMVLSFGLVCQNVSAASQAITTYIRSHLQRCDVQQDIPLLLRHVLSGTDADDDLVPALYSRSGGAQCSAHPEGRITNFRRGTMVWYLSRATGAPCPFARAGIRLCDYGELGRVGQMMVVNGIKEKRMKKGLRGDPICGQKRKRSLRSTTLIATAAAVAGTSSDSTSDLESESESESEEDDRPPPKVKLTLRLKPLSKCIAPAVSFGSTPSFSRPTSDVSNSPREIIDLTNDPDPDSSIDDDNDMCVDHQSGAVRQRLQRSCHRDERRHPLSTSYTPSIDTSYRASPSSSSSPSIIPQAYEPDYPRSPSVAYSTSSPPPETEDEEEEEEEEESEEESEEEGETAMLNYRHNSNQPWEEEEEEEEENRFEEEEEDEDIWHRDLDLDFDSEGDGETLWESPGPRSPSAPSVPFGASETVKVKDEPRDVQGMLDAWEDHFDSSSVKDMNGRALELVKRSAAVLNPDTIAGAGIRLEEEIKVKAEPLEYTPFGGQREWGLDGLNLGEFGMSLRLEGETIKIKQEEFDLDLGFDSLFPAVGVDGGGDDHGPNESPHREIKATNIYQRGKDELAPRDSSLTGSADSSSNPGASPSKYPTISTALGASTTANAGSMISTDELTTIPQPMSPGAAVLVQLIQALSMHSPTTPAGTEMSSLDTAGMQGEPSLDSNASSSHQQQQDSLQTIPPSSLVLPPPLQPQIQETCVSPQAMRMDSGVYGSGNGRGEAEGIVVHTCQPCTPPISATQIEEISVYQMMLGPYLLLRRIDTDFVNLTPIVEWCGRGKGYPVLSTVPNAVVVGREWGSERICGVWVPLEVAQAYVRDCVGNEGVQRNKGKDKKEEEVTLEGLKVFLNDELVERFPAALRDFHRTNASGRMLKQFGRWFESMVRCAQQRCPTMVAPGSGPGSGSATTGGDAASLLLDPQQMIQATLGTAPMNDAFAIGAVLAQHQQLQSLNGDDVDVVSPLNAKEQELFRELCVFPGDEEEQGDDMMVDKMDIEVKQEKRLPEATEVEVEVKKEEKSPPLHGPSPRKTRSMRSATTATAANRDVRSRESSVTVVSPGARSLSTEAMPKAINTRSTRAAIAKAVEKEKQEMRQQQQALRRSKRVADALAEKVRDQVQRQQEERSHTRKRGSRNTLS